MNISNESYAKAVKKYSPPSTFVKDFIMAYLVGGLICVIGQLLLEWYKCMGIKEEIVNMLVPITLIFLAALLTGLKLFGKIARHAGAGTLVPITGFANAVVSPAIEFKNEFADIIGHSQIA